MAEILGRGRMLQLPVVALGLAAGGALRLAGLTAAAQGVWAAATVVCLLPLTIGVLRDLFRSRFGVDVIALLAMAGALAVAEYLAAAVIALMMSGGQALEMYANRRARSELSGLVSRAPRLVHRYAAGGLESPPLADVAAGDRLLVKAGEIVPVDGVIAGHAAELDESALTGEAQPVQRAAGEVARSGVLNVGPPFDLTAIADAEGSTYASIVRLVGEAQASRAPLVRLADRYSLLFLGVTLALAAAAWLVSGSPVRALAVLVVATPCPLILAAPVALVAGISRAASHGVVVKGGAALEALARARIALFDKTGTLTLGSPRVSDVRALDGAPVAEHLRLAASLDQVSTHVFAGAVVAAALGRGLQLAFPAHSHEVPGSGIAGQVDGHDVRIGRGRWVVEEPTPEMEAVRRAAADTSRSSVFIAVDGRPAAAILLSDPLRPDAAAAIQDLRGAGIEEVGILSGDRQAVAAEVAAAVGADRYLAECTPADKLREVERARARGVTLMVGDGINDAPALAAADIGVAVGVRGETASSEAAGIVLLVDRIQGLADALRVARRSRGIALQSIVAGMALSSLAMVVAAAGFIPPLGGAVLQEAIDVLVILNALRALAGPARPRPVAGRLGAAVPELGGRRAS